MIHADEDRLRRDFDELAAIGRTVGGGVNRPAFGEAHLVARQWFLSRAEDAGLQTRVDAAGNHSAELGAQTRVLLLGSHLDTVPDGGRYDGALGVLAALEALRAVKDAGLELPVSLEAIDFSDEEGTVVGLLGSRALAGALTPEMLASPRGGRETLARALEHAGLQEGRLTEAARDPAKLAGYLELHIEQGPVLERERIDIGVVSAIAGSRSYLITFHGERRHAGTTPMDLRRDALLGASRFALSVHDTVLGEFPDCFATVGGIDVDRAAFNVVPGRVRVMLELRAPEVARLDSLEATVLERARCEAHGRGLELELARVGGWDPVALDPSMRQAVAEAAGALGLNTRSLVSGAGHDAQPLASVTPTGMVFVPSVRGVSHDAAERTHWADCVNGANVLLNAALRVACLA